MWGMKANIRTRFHLFRAEDQPPFHRHPRGSAPDEPPAPAVWYGPRFRNRDKAPSVPDPALRFATEMEDNCAAGGCSVVRETDGKTMALQQTGSACIGNGEGRKVAFLAEFLLPGMNFTT